MKPKGSILDEERDSDNQLRTQFKERWTRISSDKLTEMFRTNAKKYREVINNAIAADKTVREKFEKNQKGIELLSLPIEQLQQSMPAAGGSVDRSDLYVGDKNTGQRTANTIQVEGCFR